MKLSWKARSCLQNMHTVAKYIFCSWISYKISKSLRTRMRAKRASEFRNIRQYLAIFSNIQQYSAIFDNIRQYSAIFGNIQLYSAIFRDIRQYLAIFSNNRQYLDIFGNIQQYSAIFGKIPQKCGFCLNVRAATVVIGTHKVSLSITEQLLDVCVSLEAFWASTTKKIRSFFDAPIGTREPKILGFLGQDGPKNREKH